jgi:hypothetical protein
MSKGTPKSMSMLDQLSALRPQVPVCGEVTDWSTTEDLQEKPLMSTQPHAKPDGQSSSPKPAPSAEKSGDKPDATLDITDPFVSIPTPQGPVKVRISVFRQAALADALLRQQQVQTQLLSAQVSKEEALTRKVNAETDSIRKGNKATGMYMFASAMVALTGAVGVVGAIREGKPGKAYVTEIPAKK